MRRMIRRYCISIGVTALLYFLVAKLVFASLQLGVEPSPVWPPAGIALFVLLSQGRQVWLGVALGILLVGYWLGVPWTLAVSSASGGTLEAVIGATLLRRVNFRPSMEQLQDVLNLIVLAGLISPLLNATISTGAGILFNHLSWQTAGQIWWTFWLGDSLGILVFTPLLLAIQSHWGRWRAVKSSKSVWQMPNLPEWLLCLGLLTGISWAIFHSYPSRAIVNYPIAYLPFLFVIWASLRLGQTAGIVASFILSVTAISGTVAGKGPFDMVAEAPQQAVLLQQTFLGVITITALILAANTVERQRAESLLRQNQISLTKAQHLARLGNWDFDFEQQRWNWSDELYRLLGFPRCSTLPSLANFLVAVHPDDRSQVKQAIHKALEQKTPYRINYRLRLSDGSERIVEEQVIVNAANATGTVLDITDYKQTEEKLRLNAERNRLLSEMALRIRQSLDLDHILNTTVQEVRQLLQADRVLICQFDQAGNGYVAAEAVLPGWSSALGMTSEASVYPEIQAAYGEQQICVVNDVSKLERTPFIQQYHQQLQVKAGIGVTITLESAVPSATSSGPRLFGLLIVHQCSRIRQWQPPEIELLEQLGTQITIAIQQGQLYQQVQSLNSNLEQQVEERTLQLQVNLEKLEEMNELQNVFLHAIAHDLRTTVMGTLMILNNFQQQAGDEIKIPRSMLQRMTQSGEIQLCKLNSLLEVYANKTEGLVLQPATVQVEQLLKSVSADLHPLFEQNQAIVDFQSLSEALTVTADLAQLERVFRHLLVNAVKHNPPGVQIKVGVELWDEMLCFSIADNGRGIPPAQTEHLFDLKLRGGSGQLTGISVGLCLCQQIVAAHGGTIGVESELGKGSRFWFNLPL